MSKALAKRMQHHLTLLNSTLLDGFVLGGHTSDTSIRTRSIRKQSKISPQGLTKIKQQEFFFVSSFVRLSWLML